jgi:hypothetical protein
VNKPKTSTNEQFLIIDVLKSNGMIFTGNLSLSYKYCFEVPLAVMTLPNVNMRAMLFSSTSFLPLVLKKQLNSV